MADRNQNILATIVTSVIVAFITGAGGAYLALYKTPIKNKSAIQINSAAIENIQAMCSVQAKVEWTSQCQDGKAGDEILLVASHGNKGEWGEWSAGIPASEWNVSPWSCLKMRVKCQ